MALAYATKPGKCPRQVAPTVVALRATAVWDRTGRREKMKPGAKKSSLELATDIYRCRLEARQHYTTAKNLAETLVAPGITPEQLRPRPAPLKRCVTGEIRFEGEEVSLTCNAPGGSHGCNLAGAFDRRATL